MSDILHIPAAEYHADTTAVGHSMLRQFRVSPARYAAYYVDKTLPLPPPTSEMLLGSLGHTLVLEPERLELEYLIAECLQRRGKAWDAAVAAASDTRRTAVPGSLADKAQGIAAAVLANPIASKLLAADGPVEATLYWEHPPSGQKCKCRPDKLVLDDRYDSVLVCDLKTSSTPGLDEFAKAAGKFGYWTQASFYGDGIRMNGYDHKPLRHLLIVADSAPPYEVWVYNLSRSDVAEAQAVNWSTLDDMETCRKAGVWQHCKQATLQTLPKPAWAE